MDIDGAINNSLLSDTQRGTQDLTIMLNLKKQKQLLHSERRRMDVIEECEFTWFATNALPDLYFTPLYAIMLHDKPSTSYEECVEKALQASRYVKKSPCSFCESVYSPARSIFKHILCGLSRP